MRKMNRWLAVGLSSVVGLLLALSASRGQGEGEFAATEVPSESVEIRPTDGSFWSLQHTDSPPLPFNQLLKAFSQPMVFYYHPERVIWDPLYEIAYGLPLEWNVPLGGGDSSGPERLLIEDQLVLVAHNWAAGSGPDYSRMIETINQHMHFLSTNYNAGSDYQLTLFSLTNWPVLP